MSDKMKTKPFLNTLGFSLVELMVTLGIAGAGAIGFMQLQKTQVAGQKKNESKFDINNLSNSINAVLLQEEACRQTFNGVNLTAAATSPFPRQVFNSVNVLNPDGTARSLYSTPSLQGNVEIVRFEYQLAGPLLSGTGSGTSKYGSMNVSVVYKYNSKLIDDSKEYVKDLPYSIKVETDSSNIFQTCYSSIDDLGTDAVSQACQTIGGTFDGTNCNLILDNISTPNVSNMQNDESYVVSFGNFRTQIFPNLLSPNYVNSTINDFIPNSNVTMDNNSHVIINNPPEDSSHIVSKEYVDNLLKACGPGEIAIISNTAPNGVTCEQLLCNDSRDGNQQYLVGIDGDGNKLCHPLITEDNSTCPDKGRLVVESDGSIRYECCTAQCTDSANYCDGDVYTSSNNCGMCTGNKPAQDATWSAWVDTGATRTKSGATCSVSCGGGTIAIEKEQTRACNNDAQCGGGSCSGNSQQWVDSGTTSCNTQSCPPTQTSGQYKWCTSPEPAACVCMDIALHSYPVAIEYCQNDTQASSCMVMGPCEGGRSAEWTWTGASQGSCGNNCQLTETQVCSTGVASDCTGSPQTRQVSCVPNNRCCAPGGVGGSVPAGTITGTVMPSTSESYSGSNNYCLNYYTLYKCSPGASGSSHGWINYNTKGDSSSDLSYEYCNIYGSCSSTGNHCSRFPTNYCYVTDDGAANADGTYKVRKIQYGMSGTAYYYDEYDSFSGPASPTELQNYYYNGGVTCLSTSPSPAPVEVSW